MNKSIVSRNLPALRETDEQNSSTSSIVADEEAAAIEQHIITPKPLRWQSAHRSILRGAQISFTTPKAPVPSHLHQPAVARVGSVSTRATPTSVQGTPFVTVPSSEASRLGGARGASSSTAKSRWQSASFMRSDLANMAAAVTPIPSRLRDLSVDDRSESLLGTGEQRQRSMLASSDRYSQPPRSTTMSQSDNAYNRSPGQ